MVLSTSVVIKLGRASTVPFRLMFGRASRLFQTDSVGPIES